MSMNNGLKEWLLEDSAVLSVLHAWLATLARRSHLRLWVIMRWRGDQKRGQHELNIEGSHVMQDPLRRVPLRAWDPRGPPKEGLLHSRKMMGNPGRPAVLG